MTVSPGRVLVVRPAGQLVAGSLVWYCTTGSWSLVAAARRCDGTGPAHPRRGDPCAALTLRPVAVVETGPVAEVHFGLDTRLVVVADGEVTGGPVQ
jgi:hypothetical protein